MTANENQHATLSSKKPKFEDMISNETVMGTGDLNSVVAHKVRSEKAVADDNSQSYK